MVGLRQFHLLSLLMLRMLLQNLLPHLQYRRYGLSVFEVSASSVLAMRGLQRTQQPPHLMAQVAFCSSEHCRGLLLMPLLLIRSVSQDLTSRVLAQQAPLLHPA